MCKPAPSLTVYKRNYIEVCNTGRGLLKFIYGLTTLQFTYNKPM